jgi:hypothetical protein
MVSELTVAHGQQSARVEASSELERSPICSSDPVVAREVAPASPDGKT